MRADRSYEFKEEWRRRTARNGEHSVVIVRTILKLRIQTKLRENALLFLQLFHKLFSSELCNVFFKSFYFFKVLDFS